MTVTAAVDLDLHRCLRMEQMRLLRLVAKKARAGWYAGAKDTKALADEFGRQAEALWARIESAET